MYHVEYLAKKVLGWLKLTLVFALILIGLNQFGLSAPQRWILFFVVGFLLFLANEELIKYRANLDRALCASKVRDEELEAGINRSLATIATKQEDIMAIGRETQAALTELREAIATEADQAAAKIIAHLNADEQTAEAIREAVEGVKSIIPDNVEDTDIPTADTPADEPAEGGDDTPVGSVSEDDEDDEVAPEDDEVAPEDDTEV